MSDQIAPGSERTVLPPITVVVRRPDLILCLPPSFVGGAYRGGVDERIVVFDNPVGQPPRRLRIWLQYDPESASNCRIGVNIPITSERYVLLGIGERQFRAPLSWVTTAPNRIGEAIVSGVPIALIIDPKADDFKIALLP